MIDFVMPIDHGPGHIADHLHLHVLVAVAIQLRADLLHQVHAIHVGHITDVVFGGDLVGQNRAGGVGEHVAAPDAVQVERGFEALHAHDVERIVGNVAGHAEILLHGFEIGVIRALAQTVQLLRGGRNLLSSEPWMSGVLPSSETSEDSILMWRQAGLSTERLFDP